MTLWQPIKTAPKDGTWIRVRGRDFGAPGGSRHYALAFFENGNWREIGSNAGRLEYLTDWRPMNDANGEIEDKK